MDLSETDLKDLICRVFLKGDTGFPISPETNLIEEGICDSMGLVQLAAELERKCPGLVVQDQDITRDNLGSISSIRRFLAR